MNGRFLVFFLIVLLASVQSRAAVRTISNAGGNYNSTATWVEGVVPTSADTVVATSTSGPLVINVASSAKVLNLLDYVNTITFNFNLTVSGDVTLDTGVTTTGSGGLIVNSSASLTSNGRALGVNLSFTATTATYTLLDEWTVNGNVQVGTTANGTQTINGFTIYCGRNLVMASNSSARVVTGSTYFVMNGKGTISSSGGVFRPQLTINTSDTITFSGLFYYGYDTLTYLSGVVKNSSATLYISGGAAVINTPGVNWNNFTVGAAVTLLADLYVDGTLTVSANINGNFNVYASGNLVTSASQSGTLVPNIILDGKCTWSSTGSFYLRNTLLINTADTVTLSGIVYYAGDTLSYVTGALKVTGSTLTLQGAIVDLKKKGLNNVTISTGVSQILDTLFVNGTLAVSGATIDGNPIVCSGGLTATASTVSGTSSIVLAGTGTWSGNFVIRNPIVISTSGTITISGAVAYNTGTFTYLSGSVVTTGSTLNVATSATFDTPGLNWNNVTLSGGTFTMSSDISVLGTLNITASTTLAGANRLDTVGALTIGTATLNLINDLVVTGNLTLGTTAVLNGGYTVYVGGSLSCTGTTTNNTGSASIVMNGTGTISSSLTTGALRIPLTINTTGTITVTGNVNYNTTLLKRLNGTINGSGTIVVAVNTPIDFNGGSLPKLNITNAGVTVTLQSDLSIISALNITGTAASHSGFVSSSSGTQRLLTLQSGATQDVAYGKATDINSSSGQTIFTYKGTLSNSSNWRQLAPSKTIAHVF